MFERFHWKRLGGSVFRYDGTGEPHERMEDWLNHVVPALMFFRSYVTANNMALKKFTLDSHSVVFIDQSDPKSAFGSVPLNGSDLNLAVPSNSQVREQALRDFVNSATKSI
jgi:hypothetical protein